MEKRKSRLMGQILVYLFLGVLTIFTLYPILYVVLGSFK